MYLTYNEYTVINNKWQLLPLYMYVCQYNVMYCVSLNLLTVASQPLCCHVDEMEEASIGRSWLINEHSYLLNSGFARTRSKILCRYTRVATVG